MEKDYENVKKLVENFKPTNNRQKEDKEVFLWCMDNMPDLLTTKNEQFHFTATAFIVNTKRDKVLSIYRNTCDSWALPCGHADNMKVMLNVALKEAKEETSIKEFNVLNCGEPITIEKLLVDQHYKGNKLVYEHYHLNFTFALEADDTLPLVINTTENSDIKWMEFDEFLESVSEKNMDEVYKTMIKQIKKGL
ncbi:MAG: NUDIX domain-containing protein [Clostridiales bacterium]|nr:NUDIX domain-containing protein [Candidatus Apopatousia equi]